MNVLKCNWCETGLVFQVVLKHVVSEDFNFKKSVHARDRFCIPPRMKKSMALFHFKNFACHVALLLKRKFQCVGHIQVVLWVSGSKGVTHFYCMGLDLVIH